MRYSRHFLATFIFISFIFLSVSSTFAEEDKRPNILLIIADDLGFSDMGSFGGEVSTPNLDKLAIKGTRLTNFHTAPTCSPTRSMLMSGTDNHLAGLGSMAETLKPNQIGKPGHEGYLNFDVVSLASLLKDAGYHTYMTGKWHLGKDEHTSPRSRGFEKSFALLQGGANHFNDIGLFPDDKKALFRENGKPANIPENFYSSIFYTDKMIDYIGSEKSDQEPFFAYLSYTAPHWPLQAPDAYIEKYKGHYDAGYEKIRHLRLQRMEELGLFPKNIRLPVNNPEGMSWDDLSAEEKRYESRTMEVYAAMVDLLDEQVGRLLSHLDATGQLDNTFIFFMSDNGAQGKDLKTHPRAGEWIKEEFDHSYDNMGKASSYLDPGANWAQVQGTPNRLYKTFTSEGGIRTPAFAFFGDKLQSKKISNDFSSVMDLMPTFLDLAKTQHPGHNYKGRRVHNMKGNSMLPFLQGKESSIHDAEYVMGWELFGHRAVYKNGYKLLQLIGPHGTDGWQLYNLNKDISEEYNLAKVEPNKLREMISLWEKYESDNGVILPPID